MSNGNILGNFFDSQAKEDVTIIQRHNHSRAIIIKGDQNPITLSTTNSAWSDLSNMITEIASAGTMSTLVGGLEGNSFDLHWSIVSEPSANGDYELALYKGASGSEEEIARIAFTRSGALISNITQKVQTIRMNKSTRISAALQNGNAAVNTVNIKLSGHIYVTPAP